MRATEIFSAAARRVPSLPLADLALFVVVIAIALGGYLQLVDVLAAGHLLSQDNLVFDFDPLRYTQLWCETPIPDGTVTPQYLVRHPAIVAVRPLCLTLMQLGGSPSFAALAIAALFVSISTGLVFACGRAMGVDRVFSLAAAALFACSATPLFTSAIPEAYNVAETGLLLQFLSAIHSCKLAPFSFPTRVLVGIWNLGVTVTNVIASMLCEVLLQTKGDPWVAGIRRSALYLFAVISGGAALSVVLTSFFLSDRLSGVEAAKNIWWAVNMPIDYRQPPQVVAGTFAVSSVVAPQFSQIQIGTGESGGMLDFRDLDFDDIATIAVLPWVLLLGLSTLAAVRDKEFRAFWVIVATWFCFNVLLHTFWQLRGSVFLYSSHPHAALMMLPFALGRFSGRQPGLRLAATALVLTVAALAAVSNLQRFDAMVMWLNQPR